MPRVPPTGLERLGGGTVRHGVGARQGAGRAGAVVDGTGALLLEGYGSAGHGRLVDSDTLFRVGSISKTVTWIAIQQLVEQGRIGLDDAAEKYLPELANQKVMENFDAATGADQLRPATTATTGKSIQTHRSEVNTHFTPTNVRPLTPGAGDTQQLGHHLHGPS